MQTGSAVNMPAIVVDRPELVGVGMTRSAKKSKASARSSPQWACCLLWDCRRGVG